MKGGTKDLFGGNWSPVPTSWSWVKVAPPGGGVLHVLILETPLGRQGLAFSDEDLAEFIRTAQEVSTGLSIPAAPLAVVKP